MKDGNGNDLVVGDSVHVKIGNEWIIGTVEKIQNGGIAVAGVNHGKNNQNVGVTPDVLIVQVGIGFAEQPGMPHGGVLKLSTKARVEGIVESTIKM